VSLARQNPNNFGDYATVQKAIIENYKTIVTTGYYGQVYVFL